MSRVKHWMNTRRLLRHLPILELEPLLLAPVRTAIMVDKIKELAKVDPMTCNNETFESIIRNLRLDSRIVKRESKIEKD